MEKQQSEIAVIVSEPIKESTNKSKKHWKRPTLDDVSGRVMAQPYIRFT